MSNDPISSPAHMVNRPATIPAIKEWSIGNETYTFAPNTRILSRNPELAETASVLAADLLLLTGLTIPVAEEESSQPGDIVLTFDKRERAEGTQSEQGYRLEIARYVTISACTDDGVFLWHTLAAPVAQRELYPPWRCGQRLAGLSPTRLDGRCWTPVFFSALAGKSYTRPRVPEIQLLPPALF